MDTFLIIPHGKQVTKNIYLKKNLFLSLILLIIRIKLYIEKKAALFLAMIQLNIILLMNLNLNQVNAEANYTKIHMILGEIGLIFISV